MERRCDKCEWWQNYEGDDSADKYCFRFPPREADGKMPGHCWCGEFKGMKSGPADLLTFKQAREAAFLVAWEYCGGDIPEMAVVLEISRPTVRAYFTLLKPSVPRDGFKAKERK